MFKIVVVSGFSGSGKTTLVNKFLKDYSLSLNINRVITYTTRACREGEVAGVDYYFISESDFFYLKSQNFFAESSDFYGTWYGVSKESLLNLSSNLIMILDIEGARALKEHFENVFLVWIDLPSKDYLGKRLSLRGESQDIIEKRASIFEQEAKHPYLKNFDLIIQSDDLEVTYVNFSKLILSIFL